MKTIERIVAENIKHFRLEKGFSQEKLAELSNLHRTYISSIERCCRNVSIKNIEKIAIALDIDVYRLFLERTEDDGRK